MNKIKNIIPSFLFLFVIGGIVYFVFVLPHKERIKQEGIQQREKLKIENEIKKMVIKWNAITDWKERFDEKIKNSELITTLDFQNNLINDKNRPILVFGAILDIERKADNIYLVTTIDALGFDLKTCFIISLSSKQYEDIVKHPIDRRSREKFAFIMSVQKIEAPQFVTAPGVFYFKRNDFATTIYGDCLDTIFVGYYDVKLFTRHKLSH